MLEEEWETKRVAISIAACEIHADFGERFKSEAPKGAFIHKTGGRTPSARQRARQMIPDFLFGSTACG